MNREIAIDAVAIATLFALVCVIARAAGFDHVSDDDFARVTIAQSFAHNPKLDPSGTSWLPFPFWLMGSAMMLVGRSLQAARVLSVVFASAAMMLPYVALRTAAKMDRVPSLVAVVFAMSTPWSIWSGAATVPESLTASLMTAGVIGLVVPMPNGDDHVSHPKRALGFAACLFAACLSRYEVWPAALFVALSLIAHRQHRNRTTVRLAAVCVAAPVMWMAWNAYAHDGPFHFFRRVSNFKKAIDDGSVSTWDAVLLYPRLLLTVRPEVTLLATAIVIALAKKNALSLRTNRWPLVVLAALTQVAFLSYGNARDGAPTHHAERALLGTFTLLAIFAAHSILTLTTSKTRQAVILCVATTFALTVMRSLSLTQMPGNTNWEDRTVQIARGESLRPESHLTVTPCQYEHFALIASYGKPESVTLLPPTKAPVTADCPRVSRVEELR